jgi:hypothetical protein
VRRRYVTNFSSLFELGLGWDTNGDSVADAAEVEAFLFDINANQFVTANVMTAFPGMSWAALLNSPAATNISGSTTTPVPTTTTPARWRREDDPEVPTLGEYAVAQLQSPDQPLRAKLAELIGVWNGLVVASKPFAYLADLPAPNSTACYGFVEPVSYNTSLHVLRDVCKCPPPPHTHTYARAYTGTCPSPSQSVCALNVTVQRTHVQNVGIGVGGFASCVRVDI